MVFFSRLRLRPNPFFLGMALFPVPVILYGKGPNPNFASQLAVIFSCALVFYTSRPPYQSMGHPHFIADNTVS